MARFFSLVKLRFLMKCGYGRMDGMEPIYAAYRGNGQRMRRCYGPCCFRNALTAPKADSVFFHVLSQYGSAGPGARAQRGARG